MLPEQELFFIQLYENNFWKLKRYASMFFNPNQAEEVVQDTFHEGVEKIDILFGHKKPEGWLMDVLKNKMRNLQRKKQRDLLRFVSLDSEAAAAIPDPEVIEAAAEQPAKEKESVMKKIEEALSEEELYILKKLVFERSSHRELSDKLGITVWASQKRMERIRDKLGKLFPGHRKK